MPKRFTKKLAAARDERGFTLIELLVVVIIIGILVGIAIPTYVIQRQKAYNADAASVSHNATTAALVYFTENRTYAGMDEAALDAIESTLPNAQDAPPYDGAGTYAVTVFGGGTDFRVDVRHSRGSETYRSTNAGSTVVP